MSDSWLEQTLPSLALEKKRGTAVPPQGLGMGMEPGQAPLAARQHTGSALVRAGKGVLW